MRQPIGIGNFYPGEADLLAEEITACYEGQRGPGALPLASHPDRVRAIIAPNSPYRNCGQCLAWAYRRVAQTPPADVYVILGANKGPETVLSVDAFRTPFQEARIDQELARSLIEKKTVELGPDAHARETSIEVQLPFLQHALGAEAEHLKILPLLVGDETDIRALALDLKEAITDAKRNPIFIVSTALTRYGPLFKFVPFVSDVPRRIQELDDALLARIKAMDADGLRATIDEQISAMDGARCVELLLRVLRPCTVEVEQVFTSGDVILDWKNTVTYAAVVFTEKPRSSTHEAEPVEFE